MTRIRRINVSQVEGGSADNTDIGQIRPAGETAFYIGDNNKLTLMMFDGVRTHLKSKVLSPGVLFGSNADAGDGSGSDTIKLIPDAALFNSGSDQYIVVDPTGGQPGHIHLRAGGTQDASTANLYLGGEQTFVRVSDTTDNVAIRTGLSAAIEDVGVAVVDELVPPGGVWRLFINDSTYPTLGTTVQIGETVTTSWGTPVTATIVDIQQDAGNWQIHVDQNITAGFNPYNTVTFNRGSKTWTFGSTGNLTLPNNAVIRTDGGNVEVGDVTNFNVEAAGVVNIYTNDGAHQWQFGDDGSLTVPGNIKNTTTLGGEISIITASTQGDPAKTWTITHNGQGALLVPNGSAIRSENRFHITPYNSAFENFTNIVDFDTNSFVEFTEINIINPSAGILDKINPSSPNYIGGTGAKVRLIHGDNRVHDTTLTGGFASNGTDPGTGTPLYTATIPYFNISGSLIKDLGIGTSATWQFSQDGSLRFPDATTTTGKSITVPVDQSLTVNTSHSIGPGGETTFKINPESIKLPTGNGIIFSGTETPANRWGLDSGNKTLFFPDAGDGVYPQIIYSSPDTVTGMELVTFAKSIKITAGQTNSWTFGAAGSLTFPDTTVQTTAFTGTGAITFTANEIEGNTFGGTGTLITKTVDNTGNDYSTGGGSLGFLNFGTDGNIQNVKAGWTVTFASGATRTVSQDAYQPLGTYWNIGFDSAYTWSAGNVMPVTFSSPDYVAGTDPEVTLTAGAKSWTFDDAGTLTFPGTMAIETTYGGASTLVVDGKAHTVELRSNEYILIGYNNSSGNVYIGNQTSGQVDIVSNKFRVMATVPTSSTGADGDMVGMIAVGGGYLYVCTANWVSPGTANIWTRTALTTGAW